MTALTVFVESVSDMFRLTFAVWLMAFKSTNADLCRQEYDVTHGCDQSYGNVIETLSTVTSEMQCLMHCSGHDRCLSVKHNVTNKVCQLNSERFISMSQNCLTMLDYAKLTKRSCRKLINDDCSTSDECSVTHSQCFLNKCRCDPGYSYKYVNESCVPSCDAYGSTFTVYFGYRVLDYNNRQVTNVASSVACVQICTEITAFVCRAFDYWPEDKICNMSDETALTKPSNYIPGDNSYYYHRNCQ